MPILKLHVETHFFFQRPPFNLPCLNPLKDTFIHPFISLASPLSRIDAQACAISLLRRSLAVSRYSKDAPRLQIFAALGAQRRVHSLRSAGIGFETVSCAFTKATSARTSASMGVSKRSNSSRNVRTSSVRNCGVHESASCCTLDVLHRHTSDVKIPASTTNFRPRFQYGIHPLLHLFVSRLSVCPKRASCQHIVPNEDSSFFSGSRDD